jgi:NADPH-dependent 2,4-dienoyl-CoA reductase/sulfur reductase-like enzyme
VDGHARSVALALPSERMWPLPIYELALLTAGNLREHGADAVTVWLVTPEEEPLELVGPAAARALLPMLEARDIRLRTSSLPAFVKDRTLVLAGDQAVRPEAVEDLRHRVIYATAKLEQSSRLTGPRSSGHLL